MQHNELHTEPNELHTLATIASDLGVSKRSAQNWLAAAQAGEHGEIGRIVDGQRVFSDRERDILLSYASDRAKAPKATKATKAPTEAPVSGAITVVEGNHRATLSAPSFGGVINLGNQRGELEVLNYSDPMALAANALAVMGANAHAMAADLARQQEQLAQTVNAVAALKAQAEAMAAQQAEYRIKSDLLAVIQNQQTGELTNLLGKAQAITNGGAS